jgi:hypothetical protein
MTDDIDTTHMVKDVMRHVREPHRPSRAALLHKLHAAMQKLGGDIMKGADIPDVCTHRDEPRGPVGMMIL